METTAYVDPSDPQFMTENTFNGYENWTDIVLIKSAPGGPLVKTGAAAGAKRSKKITARS